MLVVTVNVTWRPAAASASMNSTNSAPASALISMTGTSCGKLACPKSTPVRSSLLPSLKMITAVGARLDRVGDLLVEEAGPALDQRDVAGEAVKSASSHPAFEVLSGWPTGNGTMLSFTPWTTPVTVPVPE